MLQNGKQHWTSFNWDTAKEVLVSGDAAAGQIYDGFTAKAREEGANVEYAYPTQGYVAWMDNVVLLKNAPNRDNVVKFVDFLFERENIATVTNFAQYNAGINGIEEFLDPALAQQPEKNPHANAGPGVFIEACNEETQAVYDQIWTNQKITTPRSRFLLEHTPLDANIPSGEYFCPGYDSAGRRTGSIRRADIGVQHDQLPFDDEVQPATGVSAKVFDGDDRYRSA